MALLDLFGLRKVKQYLDEKFATKLNANEKGVPGGIAELDDGGHVPTSQLPGFVDDVEEYPTRMLFPNPGTSGKLYVDLSTNLTYRWGGSNYVEISPSIAIGETAETAFAGNRGVGLEQRMTSAENMFPNKANKANTILDSYLSRGRKSNTNIGVGSLAFGNDVSAIGNYSQAYGSQTVASANSSHAEGVSTAASGIGSHSDGISTEAYGEGSHSEGSETIADKNYSHAEGVRTMANGVGSHAEGIESEASGSYSHAEGQSTASGEGSHSEGYLSQAIGDYSHNTDYQKPL